MIGFSTLLVILVVIAGIGAFFMNSIDSEYSYVLEYPNARYKYMMRLEVGLMDLRRIVTMAAFQTGNQEGIAELQREIYETRTYMRNSINSFKASVESDPSFDDAMRSIRVEQAEALEVLIFQYIGEVADPILDAARVGDLDTVMLILPEGARISDEMYVKFGVLFTEIYYLMERINSDLSDTSRGIIVLMIFIALIGLTIGIVMAMLISGSITKPINKLVIALEDVADGNLSVNVSNADVSKDEIGVLTRDVLVLVDVIRGTSREVYEMVEAAADKGDLQFHINENNYHGEWRNIMVGLNRIAEAVDKPVVEIRDTMAILDQGNFDTLINGNYVGDFLDIKNAVNATITNMSKYIHEIDDCLSAIASGDLTRSVSKDINFVGDYATIKESINNIVDTLHKTMSEISMASEQVMSGAKQISMSAIDLANGAQEQASSVQQLNASIDMVNEQTWRNVEHTSQANDLSVKSAEGATEGNEAMKQMLVAMAEIEESSRNISKVIKVIQDITFQTNLLALNAAVEAARAGEHGRGFSVVAEEVRSLASRSQSAAAETTDFINDSNSRVASGSDIADSTSRSLDIIVTNANEVLEIINGISQASKEQAEAIEQISVGLAQISQVVQTNSALSEETAATAEELDSQVEMLQNLVSYFKL